MKRDKNWYVQRLKTMCLQEPVQYNNAEITARAFEFLRFETNQEQFWVASVNTKNVFINRTMLFLGGLSGVNCYPREIFKQALHDNAAAFIVLHNHPSGDPTPSAEDREATRKLQELGTMMGITCHDHIVIGRERYFSIKENNTFNF